MTKWDSRLCPHLADTQHAVCYWYTCASYQFSPFFPNFRSTIIFPNQTVFTIDQAAGLAESPAISTQMGASKPSPSGCIYPTQTAPQPWPAQGMPACPNKIKSAVHHGRRILALCFLLARVRCTALFVVSYRDVAYGEPRFPTMVYTRRQRSCPYFKWEINREMGHDACRHG